MADREKVINEIEEEIRLGEHWDEICRTVSLQLLNDILVLLKEQEAVTEYVIDDFQPTCKACGFRPFAGYIPSLEWMRERGFKYCPQCGQAVKWNADGA